MTQHDVVSTRPLARSLRLVRANLGAYLVLNALMYGAVLAGMVAGLLFPELTAARASGLDDDGTTDLVVSLMSNVPLFALTIFAVNVFTVAIAAILLPSLVVPFAGVAIGVYHAATFGVTLAPVDDTIAVLLIPHSLTILIEVQAYVLVMLGAYLLGRAWLRPASVGADTRRQGYLAGLRQVGLLSLPALALFVVGAVYEALSLRYILPLLVGV
ncbi:stage II sporulation protein M [Pseudonocardia nematodicida]|uniref:Stage II sporulation protein M n=1 Tax=Pseudonocardia nematodicida TaxID=1206997 RepID=A0ABV1KF28_9PSEU